MVHRDNPGSADMLYHQGAKFFSGGPTRVEQPYDLITMVTHKTMLLIEFFGNAVVRLKPVGEIQWPEAHR
jgi:hypothetical protein